MGALTTVLEADVVSMVELAGKDVARVVCKDDVDVDGWNDVVIVNTACVPTTALGYVEHRR